LLRVVVSVSIFVCSNRNLNGVPQGKNELIHSVIVSASLCVLVIEAFGQFLIENIAERAQNLTLNPLKMQE
jgi:hypothetical protein